MNQKKPPYLKTTPKVDNPLKQLGILSAIGLQMGVIIAVGTFIGIKLDEKYPNERNLFTLIVTFLSVILSIYFVIRRVVSTPKENK
ncbi:MAG: AtpZ/AtpI family protein [Flavobacteriaceae bacterium]